jgi:hypothetical protein
MDLLASWTLLHGKSQRIIELLRGNLAQLPPEHAVDLMVVSAFANHYEPTFTSLIGALHSAGVSVAELADHKQADLREQYACWLSYPLPDKYTFRQILCIESGWRGSPPEITDDLFRAIAPYLLTSLPNATVAMPLIGTGDQGWPASQMMESILLAAVAWINRGLPLNVLKIVVYSEQTALRALEKFKEIQLRLPTPQKARSEFDLFMSYCHADSTIAQTIHAEIKRACPNANIFFDRESLSHGKSWLTHVAEALDHSTQVAALYTPGYWTSTYCKDEFAAALARQNDTGQSILFPIYVSSAEIPYLFRNLQFADCRESDSLKLNDVSRILARRIT